MPRENKRPAESLEEPETSEVKRQKLDDSDVKSATNTEDDPIEADEGICDDIAIPSPRDVATTGDTLSVVAPQISEQKGGAKKKGPDIHFKENPYTFLSPDDPVLRACL